MDDYCQIFINTDMPYEELFQKIFQYLGGEKSGRHSIRNAWGDIDVSHNGWYDENQTDFVYWRYCLDINIMPDFPFENYISEIKNLIVYLKCFCEVVPACDFENNLN